MHSSSTKIVFSLTLIDSSATHHQPSAAFAQERQQSETSPDWSKLMFVQNLTNHKAS